jgi:ankyrin repeat protein
MESHRMSSAGSTESSGTTLDISNFSDQRPILFQYAEKEKWRKVRRSLFRPRAPIFVKERDSTGLTFLGLCVGLDAPLDILVRILSLHPQQAFEVDLFGASALHLACLNGASVQVVQLLTDACKGLVSTVDADDRLPIHHTADCLSRYEMDVNLCVDVMRLMLNIEPEIINARDKNGDTPVDLIQRARCEENISEALDYNLKRVYCFLRDTYVQLWRIKKVQWERESTAEKDEKPPSDHSVPTDISSTGSISQLSGQRSSFSQFQISVGGINGYMLSEDMDIDMQSFGS